jgi:phosphatidate phosphatase
MVTHILTIIGKITAGRLRPHFLDVCEPNYASFNCTDEWGLPLYVQHFTCLGDSGLVAEARLSWPSGHSSFAAFFSVFLAVYISSLPVVPFRTVLLTFLSFMILLLIGLSRISDNKHHATDVLSGWILGGGVAAGISYVFWEVLYVPQQSSRVIESPLRHFREQEEEDGPLSRNYSQ